MKVPKAKQLPSGQWFCRVRVDGQDVCITRPTEKAAVAEAMAVKAGMQNAAKPENITFTKAIDKYIRDRDGILSPSTIRGYRTVQRNRFQNLMETPVAKLTFSNIQSAVNREAKEYSPKTVRNSFGLMTAVLGEFRPDLDLSRIKLPMKIEKEKVIYTADELRRFLDQVKDSNIELPVLLAVWLGLRRSEIIGLRWEDVDFKRGTISIREALVPDENNNYVAKGTKTVKSHRTLPAPGYILELISRQEREGERIITSCPQVIMNRMQRAADAAGVPFIGLHALRHQNASIMLSLNIPDKYAMERGGWSSNQTMKNIYQHTVDDGKQQAAKAIDGYFDTLTSKQKPKRYRLKKTGL
jgi:integrase